LRTKELTAETRTFEHIYAANKVGVAIERRRWLKRDVADFQFGKVGAEQGAASTIRPIIDHRAHAGDFKRSLHGKKCRRLGLQEEGIAAMCGKVEACEGGLCSNMLGASFVAKCRCNSQTSPNSSHGANSIAHKRYTVVRKHIFCLIESGVMGNSLDPNRKGPQLSPRPFLMA